MYRILTLISIICSVHLNAQTGIGTTTPNASAKLDVYSDNKGFLPPRVSLTGVYDASTIPSPAIGLLVYSKGDAGLASGYYYWNGSAWATIATEGGSGSFASSFMRGSRTAAQSGLTQNSVVVFTQVENIAGNHISLNTTTGKITLSPGNTYRLVAGVPNYYGGRAAFMWYNETTSSYIGNATNTYSPSDAAANGAFGGNAQVIITPNATTVLSFRLLSNTNTSASGNGDFPTTGSYPWFEAQVISGNSPVTGQSVDYVSTSLSSNITAVGGNTDIKLQQLNGGNIPYDATTGVYTLSANKTYMMQAQLRVSTASTAAAYLAYTWVDAINNTELITNSEALSSSNTSGAGFGSKDVVQIIYTPSTNQTVKLRSITSVGTQTIWLGTASIVQIGSSAIVNPWVLSGNDVYNTTGNVGIGTSAPTSKLNIAGGGIKIASGLGNTSTRPALNTTSIGNYEIRGVGGGTTQWDTQDDGFLRLSAGGGTSVITQSSIDISGYSTIPDMSNNIVMRTGGAERLRIDPSGNVNVTGKINVSDATGNVVTKVSGYVNAGNFIILDNLKATVASSGNRGLCLATVSGSFVCNIAGTYGNTAGGSGSSARVITYNTTVSNSAFGWHFGAEGDMATYIINDTTNNKVYRVIMMIGYSYNNNFLSIERLL